jgi:hypothetical protein
MMKRVLSAALLLVSGSAAALAGDGLPSHSKLSKMGLGSMKVADDAQGLQVRGRGFGALGIAFITTSTGAQITTPVSGGLTFGTEPATGEISRHGALGTVVFARTPDGLIITPPQFVNTPFEISTAISVNGVTNVTTFKFSGNMFGQAN